MNIELRKNCPMRHENGNCLPAGGFCTAVNNPICEALQKAYYAGRFAADVVEVIRCGKCRHHLTRSGRCVKNEGIFSASDFCSKGELK